MRYHCTSIQKAKKKNEGNKPIKKPVETKCCREYRATGIFLHFWNKWESHDEKPFDSFL